MEKEISQEVAVEGMISFVSFLNNIFPLSWEDKFIKGKHLNRWAGMLANSKQTCILAPRKHSKSSTVYAYVMWLIFRNMSNNLEILYISYKGSMAAYHLKNIKGYIENNIYFKQFRFTSEAETVIKGTWDGEHKIVVEPEGILSFKRGRHPHVVVLDDVLADPTTMLDLSVINKINNRVYEDVMSLPKEGGELKIIGTAQTPEDFFFAIKRRNPRIAWGKYPAIISHKQKKVLWREMFPYKRLIEIRDNEIGEKAFEKEYMIKPIYSAEAFFKRDQLLSVVNPKLEVMKKLRTSNDVIMGWDIGKKGHPSHVSIFEIVNGVWIQRFQRFWDAMDYTEQLKRVNFLVDKFDVDKCFYDATRGEFDGFYERGELSRSKFEPIIFTNKSKYSMATEFEKLINNKQIELIDDRRMLSQILNVTNDLEAVETSEGHGDSFWSIALAVGNRKLGRVTILEDKEETIF